MPDTYHFTKDPATLVDASLTKDEAELVYQFRQQTEGLADYGVTNTRLLFFALPITAEFADGFDMKALTTAMYRGFHEELGRQTSAALNAK